MEISPRAMTIFIRLRSEMRNLRFSIFHLRFSGGAKHRASSPTPKSKIENRKSKISAFTLTEILIVIGIIVLLLALAVPTMRVLTGGRSVDAAENQLSAFLGRARGEAIALQQIRGVMLYKDL